MDREVPVEAVYEAIDYGKPNVDLLRREWKEEEIIRKNGWDRPPAALQRS